MLETIMRAVSGAALTAIRFYQRYISPLLPPSCRFQPTCSQYTYQAIERFGIWRGGWLGVRRLCRCNPFHPCGCDMVPEYWGQKMTFLPDKPVRRKATRNGPIVPEVGADGSSDTTPRERAPLEEVPGKAVAANGNNVVVTETDVKAR